jgi:hypothetical protein
MLLQFSVKNFKSFKDEAILSMIPTKSRVKKDHIIIDNEGKKTEVLPLVTIYGANASGKSNLVKAIGFMRKTILQGTKPDEKTGHISYLLDADTEKGPGEFEIIFKHEGVLYTYGFLITSFQIEQEWLFAYYSNQESLVFERNTIDGVTNVKPGTRFVDSVDGGKFIEFIARGTRPNQLFLTECRDKNIQIVKPVIDWFRSNLQVIGPDFRYNMLILRAHEEKEFVNFLSDVLNIAGTGVDRIQCESEEVEPEKFLAKYPENLKKLILDDLKENVAKNIQIQGAKDNIVLLQDDSKGPIRAIKLKAQHRRSDNKEVLFELSDESDGTLRLMELAPMLIEIRDKGKVFIIDELDRSLHTLIARLYIEILLKSVTEYNTRGQFIMTTHDTNLLDRDLLRKDEILFVEKDIHGASHLTSLAEYKVSEGLNYENGYLNGRFGAIPFVGNIRKLVK